MADDETPRGLSKIALFVALAIPAIVVRVLGIAPSPLLAILVFGGGIVAASFLLAWGAEVAQLDISASFATAVLALIAILPEYAVDAYFAYTAGHRPEYGAFAAANMTGSNRLLIGVGWPLVALFFAIAMRRKTKATPRAIVLRPRRRVELSFLAVAGLYAFVIPLKRTLSIMDAVILLSLFVAYLWRTSKQEQEEPDLHGTPAEIAKLSVGKRRATVIGFFVFAALVVLCAAKPFADSLVEGGRKLGVDEFLLVQWLAPLASEAPELLVASILALRGDDDTALGTLLSSKVNQWTLLVGSIPLAHAAGGGGMALALDARQTEEFLLTAAQAVFAVAVLLDLRFTALQAAVLFLSFAAQLFVPHPSTRIIFAGAYVVAAVVMVIVNRRHVGLTVRALGRTPDEG